MLTTKVNKINKVVVCGMKGVGKTAILEQLIYGNIAPDSVIQSTIEDTYVANIDVGRGIPETIRFYDSAGLLGNVQLPKHYVQFPDGFVLVYDPSDPTSLDLLAGIKSDIDRNKDKKEICLIVVANMRARNSKHGRRVIDDSQIKSPDPIEAILNRANSWCARERVKHFTINAMERASLYESFIHLASLLHPPQSKSTFPQLRQLTKQKSDNRM